MGENMMEKGEQEMGWRELYKGKSVPDDLCNHPLKGVQIARSRKKVVADIIPLNNTRRNTCLFTIGQFVETVHEKVRSMVTSTKGGARAPFLSNGYTE